ncbi:helix-turn-helix domain-containing protein [Streptomyces sp. NBC_00285]|uniref:helix-turn-helix domain-containing protein n=1 Tax=Streptomyces sp. NBC_00285 TaxID=2975700 RepID=UPI002E29787D|nr:helix-turn-helix domain-containing protein [Streptomyces sp. NBC_00285]
MTVVHGPEPVVGVLLDMASDTDVCGELVRAARTRSPELARIGEAETRSHVTALIRAAGPWLTALGRADAVDEQDFGAALLLGADRAVQGVAVTDVLRGVQAALTRAVEIALDRCRVAGVPDAVLLSVVLRMKEYGDAVGRHVVNGYRAAEQEAPREAGAVRGRLLRLLLVDGVAPPTEELGRAGIRSNPDGLHHCFAATAAHPHALPVSALLGGHVAGVAPSPPDPGELSPGALVVVAPAAPAAELRALYRLCARAVDLGRAQGRTGLYDLTELAAELALAEQPLLGAHLSRHLLGALDPADDFHRQLALTARTFLDHGRRLDQTAAALFTHPNTVRYRLGRLQQITGDQLGEGSPGPLHTLTYWWALTTWLHGEP